MGFVFSALLLAILVFTVVDVIRRPDDEIRYLPKIAWLLIVIIFSPIGAVLWWLLGREYAGPLTVTRPRWPRPSRRTTPPPASAPAPASAHDARTTEQQIADLDREIEEWRLREELEKRRRATEDPESSPGE